MAEATLGTASPAKPIPATLVAIVLALLLTPIPVADAAADIAALLFIGVRWAAYFRAAREFRSAGESAAAPAAGKSSDEPAGDRLPVPEAF